MLRGVTWFKKSENHCHKLIMKNDIEILNMALKHSQCRLQKEVNLWHNDSLKAFWSQMALTVEVWFTEVPYFTEKAT